MPQKARGVGRSWRTPGKLDCLRTLLGEEAGSIRSPKFRGVICRSLWFDLSAGNGSEWPDNSPGIFSTYALGSAVPVHVLLYENKRAHYDQLIEVLDTQLPALGFIGFMQGSVRCWLLLGNRLGQEVVVIARFGGGQDADTSFVRPTDAVVVFLDPNAITHWAQSATFAEEIAKRTKWYRQLSVMGCNPSGIQGVIPWERRTTEWFGWVDDQVRALPRYPKQDLMIVRLEGDAAKWGYLERTAVKWRARAEKSFITAFGNCGADVERAWHGLDPGHFRVIEEKLFWMVKEREQ